LKDLAGAHGQWGCVTFRSSHDDAHMHMGNAQNAYFPCLLLFISFFAHRRPIRDSAFLTTSPLYCSFERGKVSIGAIFPKPASIFVFRVDRLEDALKKGRRKCGQIYLQDSSHFSAATRSSYLAFYHGLFSNRWMEEEQTVK
jgi:hypothetical protein